jgi:hypothetical protein
MGWIRVADTDSLSNGFLFSTESESFYLYLIHYNSLRLNL